MTQNDYDSFCEIVLGFAELKGKQLSAPALQLFWNAMRHWPIEEFSAAANHLVRTEDFFPGPDKFEALRKASRPTVGEAWLKALSGRRSAWTPQGFTGGTCGDDLIDRAVRCIGGYAALAQCDETDLHWHEKRFAEIYENMQDAEDVRESVPMIAGPSQVKRVEGPKKLADLLPKLRESA